MKKLSCFWLMLLGLIVIPGCVTNEVSDMTTIILIRHAEKESEADDALLTEKGRLRAQKLADLFSKTDVNAIYSSPFKRNKMTVQPLADIKGLPVSLYDPDDMGFVEKVYSKHKGKTVLVVGHSNTIPFLANLFSGAKGFTDLSQYDHETWYIVTMKRPGQGKVLVMQQFIYD